MLKHIVALIVLSLAIVLAMPYAQMGVQWLLAAHDWVAQLLTEVFSGGQAGNIAREFLALLSIPLAIALIPSIIYWFLRRHWFPYFMPIFWVVWLIQAGALVAMYKAAV